MISADQGFGDVKQKSLDVKVNVQAVERKLVDAKEEFATSERKLAAAKKELADVEKKWMGAKEESAKEYYSWMMDVAKRGVDVAQKAVDVAQKAVDHYQDKLFSLEYDRRDEQIQDKFSNEGWEPRAPSASWEKKLKYFSSRDDVIDSIITYINGVKSPQFSPERDLVCGLGQHGKGFSICSTLGIMGMGKTVCWFACLLVCFFPLFVCFLCHSYRHDFCLQALMRRIHQDPSLVGAKKAIFINCNSGEGFLPDKILERSTPAKVLASALLYSSANEPRNKGFEEF